MYIDNTVTLYVRVWIETMWKKRGNQQYLVTLYVRVWIETATKFPADAASCHPLREGVD